ncbi:MAG: tRNA 2-selenouridine(34) synthase MnmH [Rhodocyclales bacterium]|nr:tRNA 2-selenouridine(34) synthase MnmH [Rhodocyclales bacterium]
MGVAVSERASNQYAKGLAKVSQLGEFDAIIDARSPSEYADDHVPGAISCPVLTDDERARVGTLYKQVSPFEAKKVGAALVARNIARHIEERFLDKPREWRPLVYCWRGGKRSGAFEHILREIGWDARKLEGGYKAWRQNIVAELAELPGRYAFRVISGATGSAKSRILEALAEQGAQILHLEALAAHKGSVLGNLPDEPQPSQKAFETRLHGALTALDPRHPVFVEAESRRIGSVQLPNALLDIIRTAPCVRIEATLEARVDFLLRDYAYFPADPRWLAEQLGRLRGLQSNETLARWLVLVEAGDFRSLVGELLERHYDPLYQRSQARNYRDYSAALPVATGDLGPAGIRALAARILAI